jgi:SnoaL-like domain
MVDAALALSEDDRLKIGDLIVEFAWRVDHGLASSMHEIVTDDIEMVLTKGTMIGKDAVKDWGIKRDAAGRTTSHLMSNIRFSHVARDRVEADSSAVIFVHGGGDVGPALPWAVTEYHDIFVKDEEGWKFKSRVSKDVFMSDSH